MAASKLLESTDEVGQKQSVAGTSRAQSSPRMKSPPKKRAKLTSASQGAKARHTKDKLEDNLAAEPSVFAEPAAISMTLPAEEVTLRNQKPEALLFETLPAEE